MRSTISDKLWAALALVSILGRRWLNLPDWVMLLSLGVVVLELVLKLLGFCIAMYQRRKEINRGELEEAKRLGETDAVPAERKGIPWGKLWLVAFLLMIFSPILLTTHWIFLLIVLLFALPWLIITIMAAGFCSAVDERRKEEERGELNDAKKF